jgi:hypothetical protein
MHARRSPVLALATLLIGAGSTRLAAQETPVPTPAAAPVQSEFAQRAGHGSGFYITRARIDRAHPEHTVELFRGVPGMDVRGSGIRMRRGSTSTRSALGLGGAGATRGCPAGVESAGCAAGFAQPGESPDCAPTVFVDGTLSPAGASDLNTVAPTDLEGIEVYGRPSTAPAQYRRDSDKCAIVLLWTRRAPGPAVLPQP